VAEFSGTGKYGNDAFWLNDIRLNIPPTSIKIDKTPHNFRWDVVRSSTPLHIRSGHSAAQIQLAIEFIGKEDIDKLQRLMAEISLTPYVYIDNEYVRQNMTANANDVRNMAGCVRSAIVHTNKGDRDHLSLELVIDWFNYFPFSSGYRFVKDYVKENEEPVAADNPQNSVPWMDWVSRAMVDRHYVIYPPARAQVDLRFIWTEFDLVKRETKKTSEAGEGKVQTPEQDADLDAEDQHLMFQQEQFEKIFLTILERAKELQEKATDNWGEAIEVAHELSYVIERSIMGELRDFSEVWEILQKGGWRLLGDETINMAASPLGLTSFTRTAAHLAKFDVMWRSRNLPIHPPSFVVTDLAFQHVNHYVQLPLAGHQYATIQHVGGADRKVMINLLVDGSEAISDLQSCWDALQENSLRMRAFSRSNPLIVVNDFLAMFGVEYLVPENLSVTTIEGNPGQYAASLSFSVDAAAKDVNQDLAYTPYLDTEPKIQEALLEKFKNLMDLDNGDSSELGAVRANLWDRQKTPGYMPQWVVKRGWGRLVQDPGGMSFLIDFVKSQLLPVLNNGIPGIAEGFNSLSAMVQMHQKGTDAGVPLMGAKLTSYLQSISTPKLNKEISEAFSDIRISDTLAILVHFESELTASTLAGSFLVDQARKGLAFYNRGTVTKDTAPLGGKYHQDYSLRQDYSEKSDLSYIPSVSSGKTPISVVNPPLGQVTVGRRPLIEVAGLSQNTQDNLKKILLKAVREIDLQIWAICGNIIRRGYLKNVTDFMDIWERIKKIGLLGGNSCYPDMALETIEEAQRGDFINPDFYFYDEGAVAWDPVALGAMVDTAKDIVQGQYKFLMDHGRGDDTTLLSWINEVYLKNHLSKAERAALDSNISKIVNTKGRAGKTAMAARNYLTDQIDTGQRRNASIAKKIQRNGKFSGPAFWADENVVNGYDSIIDAQFKVKNEGAITHGLGANDIVRGSVGSSASRGVTAAREQFGKPLDKPIFMYGGVISPFGWRGNSFHYGQDWPTDSRDANGQSDADALSIADGRVSSIKQGYKVLDGRDYSTVITVEHPQVGLATQYWHMDIRSHIPVKVGDEVKKGQSLGPIFPGCDERSRSGQDPKQGHLHFECHIRDRGKLQEAIGIIPSGYIRAGKVDPDFVLNKSIASEVGKRAWGEGYKLGDSLLDRSLKSLKESLLKNNTYTMRRAFPTFKLYFIEEDRDENRRTVHQFDDFFSYSAVHSITFHSDEDNPVSNAVITLSNVGGNLSNRRFAGDPGAFGADETNLTNKGESQNIKDMDTEQENPIKSFLLQEGLKVELKMGYDANPDKLTPLLVGTVSGVEFNETTDVVTIVVDSYGYELVQVIKGLEEPSEKETGTFFGDDAETGELLSELLAEPEMKHFGRWEPYERNPSRDALTKTWQVILDPSDDNLFPPDSELSGGGGWFFASNLRYFIYRTTIWDVFQEMTLRHPECIAYPVHYQDTWGPRMTMFFGVPSQFYFARGLKTHEQQEIEKEVIKPFEEETEGIVNKWHEGLTQILGWPGWLPDVGSSSWLLNQSIESYQKVERRFIAQYRDKLLLQEGLGREQIKPFRNYHVATSWGNIISNNIRSSPEGVANTVAVEYNEVDGFNEDTQQFEFESHAHDSGVVEMKGHATIPDHLVRELRLAGEEMINCESKIMAVRYALSALKKGYRKAYTGELVLLGNPDIKVHDIIFILDTYSDMVGPIEVGAVTHTLSKETGFITIIKPRMCVSIGEWASMSVHDALGYLVQGMYGYNTANLNAGPEGEGAPAWMNYVQKLLPGGVSYSGSAAGGLVVASTPIAGGALLTGSMLGIAMLGKKIVHYTQYGNPICVTPLVLNGKPLSAGLGTRYTQTSWFWRPVGEAVKWFSDGASGIYDAMAELSAYCGDLTSIGKPFGKASRLGPSPE